MKLRRVSRSVFDEPRRGSPAREHARDLAVVWRLVQAFLTGHVEAARECCAPNVRLAAHDPLTGVDTVAVGFDALAELVRRRAQAFGVPVRYAVHETLTDPAAGRIAIVFSPTTPEDGTPIGADRLLVYTVSRGRVSDIQLYEGPAE